ncbi:Hsp70 family protein [Paractinoplanes durhamensis]|uniref:Hsp70 family protein n=1 Tax=Paractinoplanes durhamensis TaxID=113563 RepID=UPI0031DDCE0D
MTYGLGVDLGTTWTAAAVRRGDVGEVLRLGGRRPEIPSVIFLPESGPIVVGEAATRRGEQQPERLAREFKRRVGDPVPLLVGGSPYSAHALLARQLEHVLSVATTIEQGPPASVVLTCPANWGPYKRDLLEQAARMADAPPVVLRSEPEAAAISYAAGERMSDGDVVAVYDLGGGTFDAAVLRRTAAGFELLGAPEGIEQLGGIDFDEAVFDHVTGVLPAERLSGDDPELVAALARLRRDCVDAKEALSFDTEVMIPVALPGLHTRVRLTRREFEAMIAPPLQETVRALGRALRSAEVAPDRLRAVLLAGGSSRIPLISSLVGTEFGRPVVVDPDPEHSIALGAARLTDVRTPSARPAAAPVPTPVPAAPVPAEPVPLPVPPGPPPTLELAVGRATPAEATEVLPTGPRRNRVRRLAAAAAVLVIAVGVPVAVWQLRDDGGSPAALPSSAAGTPACGFVDDFDGTTLAGAWERNRKDLTIDVSSGVADLTVPDGADIYETNLTAPMLLRPITGDFVLEATVEAAPSVFYQGAGLLLWNGATSYVRMERGFGASGTVGFEYKNGGPHQWVHGTQPDQHPIKTTATRLVLRMKRVGSTVTGSWRPADQTFYTDLATIQMKLPASVRVGVAALNRAQNGAKPTPFRARFDRIALTC